MAANPTTTEWRVGDVIADRWEVRRIGRGGLRVTYDVLDRREHDCFAAWTLQDEVLARHPEAADGFARAAGAWIGLAEHPHIVPARFVETIAGKPFVFARYVGDDTLGDWISTPRLSKDIARALQFAMECCDGMTHVASAGLVYGDLKPDNCAITETYTLMLTGVGLTNAFSDKAAGSRSIPARGGLFRTLTFRPRRPPQVQGDLISDTQALLLRPMSSSVRAGTPAYLAPEQFDEGKQAGMPADIYAFGIMLFETLTGALPFVGRTWEEFESLHKTQPAPALPAARIAAEPRALAALNALVQRCLAKKPHDRFADFAAVRGALAAVFPALTGRPAPEPLTEAQRNAATLIARGQGLHRMGRQQEAVECYNLALEEDADSWAALSCQAVALAALGRVDQALVASDRALQLCPAHDLVWTYRGMMMKAADQPEKAIECYDRAVELNPLNDRAWLRKGELLEAMGRTYDALDTISHAVELNPRNVEALLDKAALLHMMGRPVEEIECYDRALAVAPSSEDGWLGKSEALGDLGRTAEEFECLEQGLRHNPKSANLWSRKGALLVVMARPVEALAESEPSAASQGGQKTLVELAQELAAQGSHAEAVKCCDQALQENPKDAAAWYAKGAILFNHIRGYREALPCFEESLRLGLAQAAMGVAMCQRTAGRQEQTFRP
ncbi:MAG: tetratricopeptide repeat-containing serine/threonine-protein kinase [Verrucomicrobiae bacterium]|nr:tetratricopeptide repeat-containing serine/threonine-protein kinase [Verrucomicrobiae bacterium]